MYIHIYAGLYLEQLSSGGDKIQTVNYRAQCISWLKLVSTENARTGEILVRGQMPPPYPL